jgi:DNA-binding Lrp family transcriptional regulator
MSRIEVVTDRRNSDRYAQSIDQNGRLKLSDREVSLDDLDYRLVALLRSDARLPVAKLAVRTGVSRATVRARIERMTEAGVIAGYTIVLRTQTRDSAVRAVTMVEVDGKHAEAVIRKLMGFPEIRELHTTNGRWDVVAEIETATLAQFDNLLRQMREIDGIANTETSILLAPRKAIR